MVQVFWLKLVLHKQQQLLMLMLEHLHRYDIDYLTFFILDVILNYYNFMAFLDVTTDRTKAIN